MTYVATTEDNPYPANMKIRTLSKFAVLPVTYLRSWFRSRSDLALENLALRQQLAMFKQARPRPMPTDADRVFWVMLRGMWTKWSDTLIVVTPDTVVRWHREGFRRYWNSLSRRVRKPGRPRKDRTVRDLIARMAAENPTWRAPRIHGELLKLGFDVAERTVSRCLPRRPHSPDKFRQWMDFLQNHRDAIASMDFFTVPLLTFQVLYVLVIVGHGRRRVLNINVTSAPTAQWVIQQLREAFPNDNVPGYLIFDQGSNFGLPVIAAIRSLGIKPVRTSYRCPWQNGVVERWIGTCRRELLDHVIVFNERHARRLLNNYVAYYNADRCHLSLCKDAPEPRPVQHQPLEGANVTALPRVGGLHHRYEWRDAA